MATSFRPPARARPRWELEAFGDASAALYWLERRRGAPLPALRIMVDRTLRRAREHGLRPARVRRTPEMHTLDNCVAGNTYRQLKG